MGDTVIAGMTGNLDVSISRLRTSRTDSHSNNPMPRRSKLQSPADHLPEIIHIHHKSIRRSNHHIRRRILLTNLPASISNTWRSVAHSRLKKNILHRKLRKLLTHQSLIISACHHPHILDRTKRSKPLHRHLYHRHTPAQNIHELLRIFRSTHRPETASNAARHNYDMIVISHYMPPKPFQE